MMHPALQGVARVQFNGNLNIVVDGNSLVDGQGGAQTISRNLAKISPVSKSTAVNFLPDSTLLGSSPRKYQSDKGVIVYNLGVSGQNWLQMNGNGGSSADVDAAYNTSSGWYNILLAWEGTNTIVNFGYTWQQAVQYAKDYATARRLANPWNKLIIMTCLPRLNQSTNQAQVYTDNQNLDNYNAYILANYKSMGYDAVVDVRQAGSVFNLANYDIATFEAAASASGSFWATNDTAGTHIHLNSNGYWYVAQTFIMPVLKRLTRR